jgi:hypothetical protein
MKQLLPSTATLTSTSSESPAIFVDVFGIQEIKDFEGICSSLTPVDIT